MPTMRKILTILSLLLLIVPLAGCRGKPHPVLYEPGGTKVWPTVDVARAQEAALKRPMVALETSMGTIVVELYQDEAPLSVANFLQYVRDGFYEGTIFHRVEPGMVVQGGGFNAAMERKQTRDPIPNEAGNGLRNLRGTLGMARTQAMNSANSQFYINLVDNPYFNGDGVSGGYAVFGRVYDGMSVVDDMATVATGAQGGLNNVPVEPIVILSARQLQ